MTLLLMAATVVPMGATVAIMSSVSHDQSDGKLSAPGSVCYFGESSQPVAAHCDELQAAGRAACISRPL